MLLAFWRHSTHFIDGFVSVRFWYGRKFDLQCCVPNTKSLREFVSRPPECSTRLHCTMIRHDDEANVGSGTCYTLYLEYLGGLVPLLKGKRTSKIRPEFVIFDPQLPSEYIRCAPTPPSFSYAIPSLYFINVYDLIVALPQTRIYFCSIHHRWVWKVRRRRAIQRWAVVTDEQTHRKARWMNHSVRSVHRCCSGSQRVDRAVVPTPSTAASSTTIPMARCNRMIRPKPLMSSPTLIHCPRKVDWSRLHRIFGAQSSRYTVWPKPFRPI